MTELGANSPKSPFLERPVKGVSPSKQRRLNTFKRQQSISKYRQFTEQASKAYRLNDFIDKRTSMITSLKTMSDSVQLQIASNTVRNLNKEIKSYLDQAEDEVEPEKEHNRIKSTSTNFIEELEEDTKQLIFLDNPKKTKIEAKMYYMNKLLEANKKYELQEEKKKYNLPLNKKASKLVFLRNNKKPLFTPSTELKSSVGFKSYRPAGFTDSNTPSKLSHFAKKIKRKEKLKGSRFLSENLETFEEKCYSVLKTGSKLKFSFRKAPKQGKNEVQDKIIENLTVLFDKTREKDSEIQKLIKKQAISDEEYDKLRMIFIDKKCQPFLKKAQFAVQNNNRILQKNVKKTREDVKKKMMKLFKALKEISTKNLLLEYDPSEDFCTDRNELIKAIAHVDNLYWQIRKHVILNI